MKKILAFLASIFISCIIVCPCLAFADYVPYYLDTYPDYDDYISLNDSTWHIQNWVYIKAYYKQANITANYSTNNYFTLFINLDSYIINHNDSYVKINSDNTIYMAGAQSAGGHYCYFGTDSFGSNSPVHLHYYYRH